MVAGTPAREGCLNCCGLKVLSGEASFFSMSEAADSSKSMALSRARLCPTAWLRQADGQTDSQTVRQTDRQAGRQAADRQAGK